MSMQTNRACGYCFASSLNIGQGVLHDTEFDEAKKMMTGMVLDVMNLLRSSRVVTLMTLPNDGALKRGLFAEGVGFVSTEGRVCGLAADVPFVVGIDAGTICGCTGACVIDRILASSCGFSICPNGVLRTRSGRFVM